MSWPITLTCTFAQLFTPHVSATRRLHETEQPAGEWGRACSYWRVPAPTNRVALWLGHAALRFGQRLVDWLGPLGRLLRVLVAPVWQRVRALWRWLNVQILLRIFRPLRRFGRWVVRHAVPLLTRVVGQLRQLLAHLEPVLVRLTQGLEAVELAARLAAGWRRLWAPVLRTVDQWRRGSLAARRRRADSTG